MPTYVYRCQQCNNHLEVIQKFSDAPLKVCPKCQGQLQRVIHATGIVFKGSGWYITDSRSSSPTSKAAARKANDNETHKSEASAPTASESSNPQPPAPTTPSE